MTLIEWRDFLISNPDTISWNDLTSGDRAFLTDAYHSDRREQIYKKVWLHVTNAQLNNINNLLVGNNKVNSVDLVIGGKGLCVDVLTECKVGGLLFSARTIIRNLKFVYTEAVFIDE